MKFTARSVARGLTFLEIVISAGLLMTVMGLSLQLFSGFSTATRDQIATIDLESKVVKVEKLLRTELQSISSVGANAYDGTVPGQGVLVGTYDGVLLSDPGGLGRFTQVQYRPVEGYDAAAGTTILGFHRQLRFVLEAGETLDNTSEDGDRYLDEGTLLLSIDTNRSGSFDAGETIVVATQIASQPETYVGGGLPVGTNFQFFLGVGGFTTYQDQGQTGFLQIDLTFLGPEPNRSNGVRLRTNNWKFAIRNP